MHEINDLGRRLLHTIKTVQVLLQTDPNEMTLNLIHESLEIAASLAKEVANARPVPVNENEDWTDDEDA